MISKEELIYKIEEARDKIKQKYRHRAGQQHCL